MIHTVKGFSIVNKADDFLEFPSFLYGPTDVGNLISGSTTFSKSMHPMVSSLSEDINYNRLIVNSNKKE